MDYQYLNTVVSGVYKTLKMPNPFPKGMESELLKYAGIIEAEDFAGNQNYAMFSLLDDGQPTLVFSRKSLKHLSESVCYDTQCMGWHLDGETLRKSPGEKLRTPFLSEREILELEHGDRRIAGSETGRCLEQLGEFSQEAIRAILYGAFNRWAKGSTPIQIVVPDGVDYNGYVFSAVDKIYSYFPVRLRVEAGFSSCLSSTNSEKLSRLTLLFVPESRKTGRSICLDGSASAACQHYIVNTGFPGLNKLIDHLASLEDAEKRADLLNSIYEDLEQGSGFLELQPHEYAIFGDCLDILDETKEEAALIPAWQQFFANSGCYPEKLRETMVTAISGRITGAGLCTAAQNLLDAGKTPEETAAWFLNLVTAVPRVRGELWALLSAQITGGCSQEYARVTENRKLWTALAGEELVDQYLAQRAKDCVGALVAETKRLLVQDAETNKINPIFFNTRMAMLQEKIAAYPVAAADTTFCVERFGNAYEMDAALHAQLLAFAYDLVQQKYRTDASLTYEPASGDPHQVEVNLRRLRELKQSLLDWNYHLENDELLAEIDSRIALHEECLRSKEAKLINAIRRMDERDDYFWKLERLGDCIGEFDRNSCEQLSQKAAMFRPADYGSYLDAYERHYRNRLVLGKLWGSDFVNGKILSDLAQLLPANLNLKPNRKTSLVMRDLITERQNQARLFGLRDPKVYIGNSCFEADFLKYILTCDTSELQRYGAQQQAVENAVGLLLKQNFYTPEMFDSLYRLFRTYHLDPAPLMRAVMNGDFDDEYNSFESFFTNYAGAAGMRKLKKKWNKHDRRGKAWEDLTVCIQRQKNKGPFFVPFLVTLLISLLLTAGLVLSLLYKPASEADETVPTTVAATAETTAVETTYDMIGETVGETFAETIDQAEAQDSGEAEPTVSQEIVEQTQSYFSETEEAVG